MDTQISINPNEKIITTPLEDYRPCCAMVIYDPQTGKTINAKSAGDYAKPYQYPQGGIDEGEIPSVCVYRELFEETGIDENLVTIETNVPTWLCYDIPDPQPKEGHNYVGQVQAWFLLRLIDKVDLDLTKIINTAVDKELIELRWCEPQDAINDIVGFKQRVYFHALSYFAHTTMKHYENWQNLQM